MARGSTNNPLIPASILSQRSELVLSMAKVQFLVVIRTPPGTASDHCAA